MGYHDRRIRSLTRRCDLGISEWIAVVSVILAFASFAVQLAITRRQSRAEALIKVCESNRELLTLGISQPRLLTLIGSDDEETEIQRRYCQLWLNQVELMYRLHRPLSFSTEYWQGTLRDMRGFMQIPVMKAHWESNQQHYSDDFQRFVKAEVYPASGAPVAGAPPEAIEPDQASTT